MSENSENLVFHESFDSTRTADHDARPNLAQAQAEALISLLLGHTLTVPNTYAFDSRGVLDLVAAMLAARDEVRGELRPGSAAAGRLVQARPFLVCWYGADSFRTACIKQLRTVGSVDQEKKGEGRFLLSAWGAIDLDLEKRLNLAELLESAEHPEPPAWLDEHAGFTEQFEALQTIDQYAVSYDRGRPTSSAAGTDLITYLEHFLALGETGADGAAGGELAKNALAWGCPADTAMELWQRLREERDKATVENDPRRLGSRSWVHVAYHKAKKEGRNDALLLEQLRELVDTFYNARLAQSAYAEHGFLSSVPRSGGNDLQQINDLALGVIGNLRASTTRPPVDGVFTAPANAPQLQVPSLRRLFRAYWEIIGDDERFFTWQDSCDKVNDLLGKRPRDGVDRREWTARFKASWADHMSQLRSQLPQVIRADDSSLRVTVRVGGKEYQQAQHAWFAGGEETRPLAAGEAEVLLATGRYVSDVADWVKN